MLENCRLVLYLCRIFGCHPHTIDERSPLAHFRPLVLYSVLAIGAYCVGAYYSTNLVPCTPVRAMILGCFVQRISRYTRTLYMILTTLLSCLRHAEFERAVIAARKFDDLARSHRVTRADTNGLFVSRYTQWLALLVILSTWFIVGVVTRTFTKMTWPTIFIQCITRCAFSMQIAKFCFTYDALHRRFRFLNNLCRGLTEIAAEMDIGASKIFPGRLAIIDVQRMHRCLVNATNHLTAYYGCQLFCWVTCLLMDSTAYVFLSVYEAVDPRIIFFQCLLIVIFSLQFIALGFISHVTCDQANAFARMVFSVQNSDFKCAESLTELIELGVRLQMHPLRIKVIGLFELDNQFTFSIFGFILTYLVLASSIP